ncbi:MAG: tRNA pseudouridine(38-40) synthase TruA [Lachnospiraceae bacterium]|nr:tRNA pseudouridine(38-40) synthase TruA [Lachnospiraceae bacterium]
MSRRILLRVAYDGTNYSGFQVQKDRSIPTIAGVLEERLKDLTGEEIPVSGASRTDAGVHALCNLVVFDTESRIPPEKFSYALNTRLPEDIRVQSSEEVPADFHPRFIATEKTYEYRIYNARMESPVKRLYSHFTYTDLDTEAMRRAAAYLVGEHDFASFCSVYTQAKTTVRTITGIEILETGSCMPRDIVIRVSGTGFLYNMVRIIAGTLMEVGRGAIAPEKTAEILEARDRRAAGPTAPARGLTLVNYRILEDFC